MLHDPARGITETRLLAADHALAQDGAHESHHIVAVDKYPAEMVLLQPAVINEELSPRVLVDVRVLELEKERIDALEIVAPCLANDQHGAPDHITLLPGFDT